MSNTIKVFNIYGCGGGNFAGNVYDPRGIAPCINTMNGGNTQPMIIVYEGIEE